MSIYKKLHEIQKQVIGLGKDKAGSGYTYVTGSKVLEYIKPLMNSQGLLLKQEVLSITNIRNDYFVGKEATLNTPSTRREKSEILSTLQIRFTWIDVETGEKDENLFFANGQNDWDKGVGSALTYGERYFLLKYFHIATDEDDIDDPARKELEQKELEKQAEDYKKSLLEAIRNAKNSAVLKKISESLNNEWLNFVSQELSDKEKELIEKAINNSKSLDILKQIKNAIKPDMLEFFDATIKAKENELK